MLRAKDFGGGLFALASSVMTDLIHHDPLSFRAIMDAGLPQAYLQAITTSLLPQTEALCSIPSTLVALCLNTAGLELVRETRALHCLVPCFTSKAFVRALQVIVLRSNSLFPDADCSTLPPCPVL